MGAHGSGAGYWCGGCGNCHHHFGIVVSPYHRYKLQNVLVLTKTTNNMKTYLGPAVIVWACLCVSARGSRKGGGGSVIESSGGSVMNWHC